MAHSTSKHTQTIYLTSGSEGLAVDTISNQTFAIQGPTNVTFVLSGIDLSPTGIEDFSINFGDGTPIKHIEPVINLSETSYLPTKLSVDSIDHLYYQQNTTSNDISAKVTVRYLSGGSSYNKPLSGIYNIFLKQSAENMIDKNFEILNSQLLTIQGKPIPYFNLESDENIIYPCTFVELQTAAPDKDAIYLNTDPEDTTNNDAEFLFKSRISISSDAYSNTVGLSALSGSGFTVQGKTDKLYTFAFGISGEAPAYLSAYSTSARDFILSADIGNNQYTSLGTIVKSITGEFAYLIGVDFNNITVIDNTIEFLHSNLMPPEATPKTFTSAVTSSIAYGSQVYTGFAAQDLTYSYRNNSHGQSGTLGLSAVNRMKSDPDSLLIRAL